MFDCKMGQHPHLHIHRVFVYALRNKMIKQERALRNKIKKGPNNLGVVSSYCIGLTIPNIKISTWSMKIHWILEDLLSAIPWLLLRNKSLRFRWFWHPRHSCQGNPRAKKRPKCKKVGAKYLQIILLVKDCTCWLVLYFNFFIVMFLV